MIIDAIFRYIELWYKNKEFYSKVGTVESVDEAKRTITFKPIRGATLEGVRLQAAISNATGLVQIPKVGSKVVVSFFSQTDAFCSAFTEVDKIIIDTELVQLNGGENDGMVLINELVTQINRIEDKLKAHKHVYNAYPAVPTLTTPATGFIPPDLTLQFTNTTINDIENTKILQ